MKQLRIHEKLTATYKNSSSNIRIHSDESYGAYRSSPVRLVTHLCHQTTKKLPPEEARIV